MTLGLGNLVIFNISVTQQNLELHLLNFHRKINLMIAISKQIEVRLKQSAKKVNDQ